MNYLNMFFLFSVFGYGFETLLSKFFHGVFYSGILFGPWTPIYGLGAIVIYLIYTYIDKKVGNNFLKPILLFILSSIILTLLEWCGGMLIEAIFNKVYWNYEYMKYNIGHYISLEVSFIWGIASLLLIYVIMPFINKVLKKIPGWLTTIVSVLFFVDLIVTLLFK